MQFTLARLLGFNSGAGFGELFSGGIAGLLGLGQRGKRVTLAGQRRLQFLLTPRLGIKPREALLGCSDFRLGDAPFGFDPGLVGGRFGQCEFGLAQVTIGIFERSSDERAALLVSRETLFALGQFAFQLGKCCGGILGQPVGIAFVRLEPGLLPIKVFQPLFCSLKLRGQGRHTVAVRGGIIAPIRQFVPRFGKC